MRKAKYLLATMVFLMTAIVSGYGNQPLGVLSSDASEASASLDIDSVTDSVMNFVYHIPDVQVVYSDLNEKLSSTNEYVSKITAGNLLQRERMGDPTLPFVPATIVIPAGYEIDAIQVSGVNAQTLPGNYMIEWGQKPVAISSSSLEEATPPNTAAYSSNDNYPGTLYEEIGIQKSQGVSILILNLFPIQYQPASRQITWFKDMNVSITLEPIFSPLNAVKINKDSFRPLLRQVDNPDTLSTYSAMSLENTSLFTASALCDPSEEYTYIIITSEEMRDAATDYTLNDLITYRQSKGISCRLVTVEDIYSSCTGIDQPEQIRTFIKEAYENWNTSFVLLAGDTNVVPIRHLYGIDTITTHQPTNLPSDLYYQCLDGTYNSDNDELWGEPTDGEDGGEIDLMPDVYIGRASANTPEEMANFVFKTLSFEQTPMNSQLRHNVLLCGEYLGGGWYSCDEMEQLRWGNEQIKGFVTDRNSCFDTLYEKHEGPWDRFDISQKINLNRWSIINHAGHAGATSLMDLQSTTISLYLTNTTFPFLYSQGCIAGNITHASDCMGEALTTSYRIGCYATVLNTSYGIVGPAQRFQSQFWDACFGEPDIPTKYLGVLRADSIADNISYAKNDSTRWQLMTTILLGDPMVEIMDLMTLYVDPESGNDANSGKTPSFPKASIQNAVDTAMEGYDIVIASGTNHLTQPVLVNKPIRLLGSDSIEKTILSGDNQTRCLEVNHPGAIVENLTISDGIADNGGAALLLAGTIQHCILKNNTALIDGGAISGSGSGIIRKSYLLNNTAGSMGGAINGCNADTCVFSRNEAAQGGAASESVLYACTIVSNIAQASGGGIFSSRATNTIIRFNHIDMNEDNYDSSSMLNYCCSYPCPYGTGNLEADPLFINANDYHLSTNSPCIDAGETTISTTSDLNGILRPLDGNNNGIIAIDIGVYEYINPDTSRLYVDRSTGNDTNSGLSWEQAKQSIQAAVNIAPTDFTILVADGIYSSSYTTVSLEQNRVAITNRLIIKSLNGAATTIIQGDQLLDIRCVYAVDGVVIDGFTLTNGSSYSGGGIFCSSTNTFISNCMIKNNNAHSGGGGYGGNYRFCIVKDNEASSAAGLSMAIAEDCMIINNKSGYAVGGAGYSSLNRCIIMGNTAENKTAGLSYCDAQNCLIISNRCTTFTGAVEGGTLTHCTISQNKSSCYGVGGVLKATLRNCIVIDNSVNWYDCDIQYTCTTPLPPGEGNIDLPPSFVDPANNNYHLLWGSAGIDVGTANFSSDVDLDGSLRPQDGDIDMVNLPDMGAYEFNPYTSDSDHDGMPDGWEYVHGLQPLVYDADQDADGDGLSNYAEYILNLDPQNTDTDGDGISDADEDADQDGMRNLWEILYGLNPLQNDADLDADGDGLSNFWEHYLGTNPQAIDTDNDGICDGDEDSDGDTYTDSYEIICGTDPLDSNDIPVETYTDSSTLSLTKDSYIQSANPVFCYGGVDNEITVSGGDHMGGYENMFIHIDVPGDILGKVVNNAKLELYLFSNGTASMTETIFVYKVTAPWDEGPNDPLYVSFNTQPTTETEPVCQATVSGSGTWIQIDITELFNDWSLNGNNFGLQLRMPQCPGVDNRKRCWSKEGAYPELRPKVQINGPDISLQLQSATDGKDSYIQSANPVFCYGGVDNEITVSGCDHMGGYQELLVQFNLPTLPAGKTVLHADLELYLFANNNSGVEERIYAHTITEAWDEGPNDPLYVSYNTMPASESTPFSSTTVTGQGKWVTLDVTDTVIDWMELGEANHGILLKMEHIGSDNRKRFYSKNNSNASLRPKMKIWVE